MGRLEQRFEEASLRTKDRVTATITGVELTEDDTITVTYHIGSSDAETIESVDTFDVPTENSHEYRFVRLCEKAGVGLVSADEKLPGQVLEAGTTPGGEWTLLPETATQREETLVSAVREYGTSGRAIRHACSVAAAVAFPVVVPAIVWQLYGDDDEGVWAFLFAAVVVTGLGLLLWFLTYAYVRTLPYP